MVLQVGEAAGGGRPLGRVSRAGRTGWGRVHVAWRQEPAPRPVTWQPPTGSGTDLLRLMTDAPRAAEADRLPSGEADRGVEAQDHASAGRRPHPGRPPAAPRSAGSGPAGAPPLDEPERLGAALMAQLATGLLAQLRAAADGRGSAACTPTPTSVARLGAQVGRHVAAVVEAGRGGSGGADPAPTPLQRQAAHFGAAVAVEVLVTLRAAVDAADARQGRERDHGRSPAMTTRDAAQLGARTGASLVAAVLAAAEWSGRG